MNAFLNVLFGVHSAVQEQCFIKECKQFEVSSVIPCFLF